MVLKLLSGLRDVCRWLWRHVRQQIFAPVDRGSSGVSSIRRRRSDDPHWLERKFWIYFRKTSSIIILLKFMISYPGYSIHKYKQNTKQQSLIYLFDICWSPTGNFTRLTWYFLYQCIPEILIKDIFKYEFWKYKSK